MVWSGRLIKAKRRKSWEIDNMIKKGFKFYTIVPGESRAWFKTKKAAKSYLEDARFFQIQIDKENRR